MVLFRVLPSTHGRGDAAPPPHFSHLHARDQSQRGRAPTVHTIGCLQGVANLFDRQDRMAGYGPMFCDITWGAGGTTADLTLDIASKMQNMVRSGCSSTVAGLLHALRIGGCLRCIGAVGSCPRLLKAWRLGRCLCPHLPQIEECLKKLLAGLAGVRGDDDAPDVHQHAEGVP